MTTKTKTNFWGTVAIIGIIVIIFCVISTAQMITSVEETLQRQALTNAADIASNTANIINLENDAKDLKDRVSKLEISSASTNTSLASICEKVSKMENIFDRFWWLTFTIASGSIVTGGAGVYTIVKRKKN